MAVNRMVVDPDTGIPELIHRLKDDSKRLVTDEVRLAKLEVHDKVKLGGKDAMWLTAAFGVGVVALVAFTLFVVTLVGRIFNGHMWLGALVVGVIELGIGFTLLRRGAAAFKEPSYSLVETRESLKDTEVWAKAVR
jgi:positive regulator of sigma E activity